MSVVLFSVILILSYREFILSVNWSQRIFYESFGRQYQLLPRSLPPPIFTASPPVSLLQLTNPPPPPLFHPLQTHIWLNSPPTPPRHHPPHQPPLSPLPPLHLSQQSHHPAQMPFQSCFHGLQSVQHLPSVCKGKCELIELLSRTTKLLQLTLLIYENIAITCIILFFQETYATIIPKFCQSQTYSSHERSSYSVNFAKQIRYFSSENKVSFQIPYLGDREQILLF